MKDFKKFLSRAESVVLALSLIGVFFLIMQLGFIKNMEVPAFYGDYLYNSENKNTENKEKGYVILKINSVNFKGFTIKINGKENRKVDENNEIMLEVMSSDIIELDNTLSNNRVILKVVGISKNIKHPKLDDILIIDEGIKKSLTVKIE